MVNIYDLPHSGYSYKFAFKFDLNKSPIYGRQLPIIKTEEYNVIQDTYSQHQCQ